MTMDEPRTSWNWFVRAAWCQIHRMTWIRWAARMKMPCSLMGLLAQMQMQAQMLMQRQRVFRRSDALSGEKCENGSSRELLVLCQGRALSMVH